MSRAATVCVLASFLVGACATTPEPEIRTVEVKVPVPVPCVPVNLAAAPTYVDSDEALRAATDAASRYALLFAGREQRIARAGEVEPVLASPACRAPALPQ